MRTHHKSNHIFFAQNFDKLHETETEKDVLLNESEKESLKAKSAVPKKKELCK